MKPYLGLSSRDFKTAADLERPLALNLTLTTLHTASASKPFFTALFSESNWLPDTLSLTNTFQYLMGKNDTDNGNFPRRNIEDSGDEETLGDRQPEVCPIRV